MNTLQIPNSLEASAFHFYNLLLKYCSMLFEINPEVPPLFSAIITYLSLKRSLSQ